MALDVEGEADGCPTQLRRTIDLPPAERGVRPDPAPRQVVGSGLRDKKLRSVGAEAELVGPAQARRDHPGLAGRARPIAVDDGDEAVRQEVQLTSGRRKMLTVPRSFTTE